MQILNCSLINFTTIVVSIDYIYQFCDKNIIVKNGDDILPIHQINVENSNLVIILVKEVDIKRLSYLIYNHCSYSINYNKLYYSKEFNIRYYTDSKLGCEYSKDFTEFNLWSPAAASADVLIYDSGDPLCSRKPMRFGMKETNGLWHLKLFQNLKGYYYNYEIKVYDVIDEVTDPYAKACGINGLRGAIIDLKETNPEDFSEDCGPKLDSCTDAVIYEANFRDISIHPDSGITNKGKFLGLSEKNTKSSKGVSTGLSHILDLGVTHIQLMPFFDFSYESVDEDHPYKYNWGYDPQNYNIPEGSYSTNPENPLSRIYELKMTIQELHRNNLGVIMDVVYNHIYLYYKSNFHKIFPGYYFRQNDDGSICNGSNCSNDLASELPMVRKFIVDSILYWCEEYHIDGYRFDLMGLHDIQTMNTVTEKLKASGKNLMLYGEGWVLNTNLPDADKANMLNSRKMKNIGFFNDIIRDAIKGSVFKSEDKGFVNGKEDLENIIRYAVTGCTWYTDLERSVFDSPMQSINYCSCHDNLTLWDKFKASCPDASDNEIKAMCKLSEGIILTSQGVPFIHSGSEFCRTKEGIQDSFNSSDIINRIDWNRKYKFLDIYYYIIGLIKLRKEHPAFRMNSTENIKRHLSFINSPKNSVAFMLSDYANGDRWKNIIVVYNASKERVNINIPEGRYNVIVNKDLAGTETIKTVTGNLLEVDSISMKVIYQEN